MLCIRIIQLYYIGIIYILWGASERNNIRRVLNILERKFETLSTQVVSPINNVYARIMEQPVGRCRYFVYLYYQNRFDENGAHA